MTMKNAMAEKAVLDARSRLIANGVRNLKVFEFLQRRQNNHD